MVKQLLASLFLIWAFLSACGGGNDELLLGATTSVQDPGLLDELVSAFEDEHQYDVKPIVQGSGQIMELAREGELDVIMVHVPTDEQTFIDDGFGLERTSVMHNYFQVVGPADDPAGVAGATTIVEAFERIAATKQPFVSRGDASGTHKRELSVWAATGIDPAGQSWYRESASGQGQTLSLANDDDAYTIVDNSTFATFADRVDLVELHRDTASPNVYSVIRLNPDKLSEVNVAAGDAWIGFMTGDDGQRVIANYGRDEFGEPLFEALILN